MKLNRFEANHNRGLEAVRKHKGITDVTELLKIYIKFQDYDVTIWKGKYIKISKREWLDSLTSEELYKHIELLEANLDEQI